MKNLLFTKLIIATLLLAGISTSANACLIFNDNDPDACADYCPMNPSQAESLVCWL